MLHPFHCMGNWESRILEQVCTMVTPRFEVRARGQAFAFGGKRRVSLDAAEAGI